MMFKRIFMVSVLSLILACCASTQSKKERENEKNPQYQYEKAVICMNYGLVDEAIKYLDRALSLNPSHHLSYHLLGLAYEKKQNFAEAEAAIQKCLELKPDFSEARVSLGAVYEEMGNPDKAEEEYKKAYAIDNSFNASFRLAMLYYNQNKLNLALEFVQKSIQKDSSSVQANNLQGIILNKLGRYPEAINSFQNVLKIDRNYTVVSINLAVAYINNRNFDKARELLERVLPTIKDQKLKEKAYQYLEKIKELNKNQ